MYSRRLVKKIVKAIDTQVRTSHAVGRLVIEGLSSRLGNVSPAATAGPESPPVVADTEVSPGHLSVRLPLPEAEWRLLTSAEVVDFIGRCDEDTVQVIGRFEEANRRRRLVLEAVRRRIGQ